MKRILFIIAFCSPLLTQAQSIEHILKSIEQNNKELKAQKHAADATKMENRTNNNLPDPTVSYSSFYSNGAEGGHGTEFVASQGFDFPTQYIVRNRQATLQNEAVDKQQQAARREYSAECEESLSRPYSVESGKDIDGYPYEKCR